MIPYLIGAVVLGLLIFLVWYGARERKAGADAHLADGAEAREDLHDEAEKHLDQPTTGNLAALLRRWRVRGWLHDRDPGKAEDAPKPDPSRDD